MFPVKQSKRFWTEIILKQVTMQIISIFLQKKLFKYSKSPLIVSKL